MPTPAHGDSFEQVGRAAKGKTEDSHADDKIHAAICLMLEHVQGDSFQEEDEDDVSKGSCDKPTQVDDRGPTQQDQASLQAPNSAWEERLDWHLREHEERIEQIILKHLAGACLPYTFEKEETATRDQFVPGHPALPRPPIAFVTDERQRSSRNARSAGFASTVVTSSVATASIASTCNDFRVPSRVSPTHVSIASLDSRPDVIECEASHASDISFGASETMALDVGRNSVEVRAAAARKQEEQEMQKLKKVFQVADQHNQAQIELRAMSYSERFSRLSATDKANLLDLIMGMIICINMVVIGLSLDQEPTPFIIGLDGSISLCFIVEVLLKVWLFGFCGHFCPESASGKVENALDCGLIATDVTQFLIQLAQVQAGQSEMRTSLLRILRLIRLVRIIRVLRLEVFHDLLLMVSGMMSGMPTLLWAIVLFVITIYIVAMITRMVFGTHGPEAVKQEFDTMANSLFTVFRCSFGDCTTERGIPLLGMVVDYYGGFAGALLAVFAFFVTIGLFNVISAIFVEATLSAKLKAERQTNRQRLNDFTLFATNMKILIERIMYGHGKQNSKKAKTLLEKTKAANRFKSANFSVWSKEEVDTEAFKTACMEDKIVMAALRELDIHEGDFPELADILDPQNDGVLSLQDILMGITRLRGEPRRSDIVNVDLMIRDVQLTVGKIREMMSQLCIFLDPEENKIDRMKTVRNPVSAASVASRDTASLTYD